MINQVKGSRNASNNPDLVHVCPGNLCQYLDVQLNDHTSPGKEAASGWRKLKLEWTWMNRMNLNQVDP